LHGRPCGKRWAANIGAWADHDQGIKKNVGKFCRREHLEVIDVANFLVRIDIDRCRFNARSMPMRAIMVGAIKLDDEEQGFYSGLRRLVSPMRGRSSHGRFVLSSQEPATLSQ
jgi:hypothetical protein